MEAWVRFSLHLTYLHTKTNLVASHGQDFDFNTYSSVNHIRNIGNSALATKLKTRTTESISYHKFDIIFPDTLKSSFMCY